MFYDSDYEDVFRKAGVAKTAQAILGIDDSIAARMFLPPKFNVSARQASQMLDKLLETGKAAYSRI